MHKYIIKSGMFQKGETVAVCVSGGKDSTVLAHVLHKLNNKYEYGLNLKLLSVDEGIRGYRDDSLKIVEINKEDYQLELTVLGYEELYGMTMDDVMTNEKNVKKNSCSFCGVFRRKALEIGAKKLGACKMVLGHNADDLAETVVLNFMRGDFQKLVSCAADYTDDTVNKDINDGVDSLNIHAKDIKVNKNKENEKNTESQEKADIPVLRLKPMKYCYEKEIVLYAHYLDLKYFSTECTYAPASTRNLARNYIKDLEKLDPRYVMNIIKYAELLNHNFNSINKSNTNDFVDSNKESKERVYLKCLRCGMGTPNNICKACLFVEQLS